MEQRGTREGFTLIELSIVLVIIGLIVGGVLVGQDLIRAAEVRATISQIEKYNSAANTFRGKYGYLPGDIKEPEATNFGFRTRGTWQGQGDGNGALTGANGNADNGCTWPSGGGGCGNRQSAGETVMFWVDLSTAHLIDGGFTTADPVTPAGVDITGADLGLYFPPAKIGGGNYFYAFVGMSFDGVNWSNTGVNYFGLSAATSIESGAGRLLSNPSLPVAAAYAIDRKVDDGLPQSGNATAFYLNSATYWVDGTDSWDAPVTGATAGSASTCYDNGNVAGPQKYSVKQNGGAGVNCALSFRFQ
jgi:prepilin-type N-terminal cleavage/methylation domain-containing protein